MYILKHYPVDFIVKELTQLPLKSSGQYSYWKLSKRELNTPDAVKTLAGSLNISEKQLGYAGNKDKQAITEQFISIHKISRKRIENLNFSKMQLLFMGYGDEHINLGRLNGNFFEITLRNLENSELDKLVKKSGTNINFVNYFGEQRFGTNNVTIGKNIIKKNFKEAFELLISGQYPKELTEFVTKENPNKGDYIKALQCLPKRLLRLYIAAYQSYLWNLAVQKMNKPPPAEIPLVGFGTEYPDTRTESVYEELLENEAISERDFIIKQLPLMSVEGDTRKTMVECSDFVVTKHEPDNVYEGKEQATIRFSLPKGSYATVFIEQLFA